MASKEKSIIKTTWLKSVDVIKEKTPIWLTKIMAEGLDRELFLRSSLRETMLYSVFILLITIIAVGMSSPAMFYLTNILRDQFLDKPFNNIKGTTMVFQQIRSVADFWGYLQSALHDSFFWEHWYSDPSFPPTDMDDHKILYENKLLGVPRIRQLRVRNNSCPIHDYFRKTILSCFGPYSWENRDTESYGPQTETAWVYHTPDKTGAVSYWGYANTYDGGGYYQDLRSWRHDTAKIINDLRKQLWITRATRAVFLDFSVYNANLNLFCVVKLIFEFPSTGGVIPIAQFHTLKLIRYVNQFDYFVFVCECLFFVLLLYYTCEEVREIIYLKKTFFGHFWNYVDITILGLGYGYLSCALIRYSLVQTKLNKLDDYVESYPNLELVAEWQIHHNNIIAVLLFFIYMKIFKYITFNKTMAQLNNTIKNCAMDVLGFSVMFFIIFMAYAELGYLLFGSQVEQFGAFGTSTFTLLRTILGDFDYTSIEKADRVLAPIFFLSFIFFVFFILLNMFLAIITDTYSQVKTEIAVAPAEMQMSEYVKKRYYVIMNAIGLGRLVRTERVQKVEYNVTIEEIRGALKKCGFSDLEIEMFFSRFNIDPTSAAEAYDIQRILDVLEKNTPNAKDIRSTELGEGEKYPRTADGTPLVDVDEFIKQRDKIYDIENKLEILTKKVEHLCNTLEQMANVKKTLLRKDNV